MSFSTFLDSMQSTLGENLSSILGAIAILVLGWFIAILVRAAVRRSLSFLKLNSRINSATGSEIVPVE